MENGTRTARPADDVLRTAPNREAAAAIRSRARTNARVLRELKPEARAHAFAVAGIEDMERLRAAEEWDEWIKLHDTKSGTGLFRIKGTAL